mmetsp:Transcript_17673/g.30078  ORF Transcript_17673/g.30078 Transcript_17673/m.30078 type:complete len:86 (-) Transcript_17673:270-527(-)
MRWRKRLLDAALDRHAGSVVPAARGCGGPRLLLVADSRGLGDGSAACQWALVGLTWVALPARGSERGGGGSAALGRRVDAAALYG